WFASASACVLYWMKAEPPTTMLMSVVHREPQMLALPVTSVSLVTFVVPRTMMRPLKDRKSTRLNSSHLVISYAVFCLKKKTTPLMVLSLALQGMGTGFFQVAYMEIVMSTLPSAHRGVAGSLSMLTRTIVVVIGAVALNLAVQAIEMAAIASGADKTQAFLAAVHGLFRIAGVVAALTGVLVSLLFFLMNRRPPRSTLFPYTTLFR